MPVQLVEDILGSDFPFGRYSEGKIEGTETNNARQYEYDRQDA
jgi:hypothetical protein